MSTWGQSYGLPRAVAGALPLSLRQARRDRQAARAMWALFGLMGLAFLLARLAAVVVAGQRAVEAELLSRVVAVMPHPIAADDSYRITSGDCLVLWEGDEFVGEYLVNEEGAADFGDFGTAHVAGMTARDVRDVVAKHATKAAPPKVLSIEISEFRHDACVVRVDDGQNRALARLPLDEAGRFLIALAEAVGPAQANQVDIDVAISSGCQTYHGSLDLSGITRGSQPWVKNYGLTRNNIVTISPRSLSKNLHAACANGVDVFIDALDSVVSAGN